LIEPAVGGLRDIVAKRFAPLEQRIIDGQRGVYVEGEVRRGNAAIVGRRLIWRSG
jgi:hypothetical protein